MSYHITNETLVIALVFVLVLFVSYTALKKIFKNKSVTLISSIAISVLSAVYLTRYQVELLLNTYGTIGVIVMALIPWVVAFFFIYNSKISTILRRLFWIFFGTINVALLNSNTYNIANKELFITLIIIVTATLVLLDKWIRDLFSYKKTIRGR